MTRFSSWRWTCVLLLPLPLALVLAPEPAFAQAIPIARADVNHDCVVNQVDVNLLNASYNKRTGQPGFNPDADMDRDGAITLTDRTFVQRALGTRVCNPSEPAPEISASVNPIPNANGWQRGDVTITFTCSNVVSCPTPVTLTSEGANQAVDRTVSNNSGATASAHVVVNIDRTPPALAVTLPASGPPGGSVPLAFSLASVDLSGLANATVRSGATAIGTITTSPSTINVPLPPAAGASRTIEIIGTDRAGNAASIVRTLTSAAPDTTAPTVILSVVDKAAPGAIVPVRVSATDPVGLSRLILNRTEGTQSIAMGETNAAPFALQQSFTVPQVPDGTAITFNGRADDASGNAGTASATLTVSSTVESKTLEISVDPPVTPTFQSNSVLRGHLRAGTGSATPAPPAFIASLSPASGRLGDVLDVTISGINTQFDAASTQVSFGSASSAGIAIQQLTVLSPSSVRAHIAIDPKASLGPRFVAVSTGTQEALLPNAFTIVAGEGSVSGRLIASSGTPIAGRVCPSTSTSSSTACVDAAATGLFTLPITSTIGRIIATAPTFETASVLVAVAPGRAQSLGDITMVPRDDPPTPPEPGGPMLPPALVPLVARMSGVTSDPTSLTAERARKIVIDSVLLVGADELGVLDADGHQLNGDVTGSGPMSLTDAAVAQQARTLRQGATVSLEEIAIALAMGFDWTAPGPPDPDTLVAILQQRVNDAWAGPTADDSSLAILLFNQGPTLSRLPPRLSRQTRVNSLQAFLVLSSVVLQGYEAQAGTGSARLRLAPVEAASFQVSTQGLFAALGFHRFGDANTIDATRSPRVAFGQSGGGTPTHKVRQLSRLLNDFRTGFAGTVAHNLVGSLLFSVPAAMASGSLGVMTLLTAVVGSVTDTLFFAQFIPLIANLAPPPPDIVSVRQTGNKIAIQVKRVPFDIRCRTGLASDPNSQAGLCNFQYTVYRYAGGQKDRIVIARFVPPVREEVAPGVFEVEDAYPQPGMNTYYADVTHKLPLEVPDAVKHVAGVISLPTRIGIPVGSIVGLGFITELVSDYSEPNPYPLLNFNDNTKSDWDRVRVNFTPVPPVSDITALRNDKKHGVFANDQGLSQFTPVAAGTSTQAALHPGFGRGAGLDADSNGFLYSVSDLSQAQFGGRVFQVRPTGEQFFVGTVNRYSPLLDIGRPVQVAALAVGPGIGAGDYVAGDVFVADNSDRTIKRLFTSIIPIQGIGGLPAPGGGIFGAMAASPIVGQPFASFPTCGENAEPINDILIDRTNTLWALVGSSLYRMPADGSAGPTVAATLGGGMTTTSVSIKVRGSVRNDVATVIRGKLHLFAESVPCLGRFEWSTSDEDVIKLQTSITGPGSAKADAIGLKAGKATVRVRFTPLNGNITSEATVQITVYDSGPPLRARMARQGFRLGTGSGRARTRQGAAPRRLALRELGARSRPLRARAQQFQLRRSDDAHRQRRSVRLRGGRR